MESKKAHIVLEKHLGVLITLMCKQKAVKDWTGETRALGSEQDLAPLDTF